MGTSEPNQLPEFGWKTGMDKYMVMKAATHTLALCKGMRSIWASELM